MMTILNASYLDTSSAGCFTYCKPRLVQSELLEKEVRGRWTGGGVLPSECVLLIYHHL